MTDQHLFTDDNIDRQLGTAPFTLGYYTLRFYTEQGKPVNRVTDTIKEFYLYPSGGTLRDGTFNIVFYNSRFDTYRGFKPPHLLRSQTGRLSVHGHLPHIQEFQPLAPYTTLGLGGPARFFAACRSDDELRNGMAHARERGLPLLILGGGSNVVIADEGFDGLVLKLETRGTLREDGPEGVRLTVAAGEAWDDFVRVCVQQGLGGVECLSGIPGTVGATPIQNVGAYGQEVSQTIAAVIATDIRTGEGRNFFNADCRFGYRQSRFKLEDAGRYAVTGVTFVLQPDGRPQIRYPELQKQVASAVDLDALSPGAPALQAVRDCVLALRRKKSMVLDASDPNAKSVGSFFMNPVVSPEVADRLRARHAGLPSYPARGGVKIAAGWLVEHAGFPRGYRSGGAAVSENHSLALVNRGTTTAELLALARKIQEAVQEQFGIQLEREPVVIGRTPA